MKLTFRQEIPRWDEGLPLGNGALGALVWGRADTFRISLGRSDLWDLRRAESLSSPSFNYAEYVRLAKAGEAGKAAFDELFDAPYNLPYPTRIPAAALRVVVRGSQIPAPSETSEFTLDTRRAEAEVRTPTGALRLFLGAGEKIGRLRAEGDFEISLLPPPYAGADAEYGEVNRHPLTSLGYPPCRIFGGAWGQGFEQRISDTEGYAAALAFAEREGRREYAFGVRPLNPGERGEDLAAELVGALETEYEEALAPHLLWWENYFSESGVCLPEEDGDLLRQHELNEYFLACCSRRGCPPMTLQGVWLADDGALPPWKGDYHLDLNLQYSYASAFLFNHLEQGECYTDFLLSLRDAARAHARGFFGADGYILPGVMDIAGRPMTGWGQYSLSPGNQPWNCLGLDERWRYTGEEGALRDAYEYLSGSGRALLSLLVPDKEGKLVFPVSISPEFHDDTVRAFFRTQTNYDGAGLLYLFSRLADLSRLAAPEEEKEWRSVLDRLAPLSADETGFMLDKEERYSESHRHFSHLMGIYPYKIVPYRGEGAAAIDASIARLEQFGTGMWVGFSFCWAAALYALAKNGEGARYMLKIFRDCFVSPNGFHLNGDFRKRGVSSFHYRPFTLEANMLFSAALGEMLLQSEPGRLRVFPALPESWKKKVSFSNLRADGGLLVSAAMEEGRMQKLAVYSSRPSKIEAETPEGTLRATLSAGENRLI